MTIMDVEIKKNEGGFFYIPVQIGQHNKHKRVWVNVNAIEEKDDGTYTLKFPLKIGETSKGTQVLFADENGGNPFFVVAECGYRGAGWFKQRPPVDVIIQEGKKYDSQVGSLGVSEIALVLLPIDGSRVRYSYQRDGRLYGKPAFVVEEAYWDKEEQEVKTEVILEEDDEELMEALV